LINLFINESSLYPKGPLNAITYLFYLFAELLLIDISSNLLILLNQSLTIFTIAGWCRYKSNLSSPCCFYFKGLNLPSTLLQKDMICSFLSPDKQALMIFLWKNQKEFTRYARTSILM